MDLQFIKNTVFETVDFSYDGEIDFYEYDGYTVYAERIFVVKE